MILHTVALGFAAVELVLILSAGRGRKRSATGVVASVAMVTSMADGVLAPRIVPEVVWVAILIAIAMSIAFQVRLRSMPDAAEPLRTRSRAAGSLAPALGSIAMALLLVLGVDHGAAAPAQHGHGQSGAMLVVLSVALVLAAAFSGVRSWRRLAPAGKSLAARVCMVCSLTTMMAAVIR